MTTILKYNVFERVYKNDGLINIGFRDNVERKVLGKSHVTCFVKGK